MKEIWKDIKNWEGLYQVSNLGRIKSVKRGAVKALDMNNAGYLRVQLCDGNRSQKFFVHRLVAFVFVPGYFENAVVNHIDMDRTNNCADNLEWVTPSQNQKKAFDIKGFHAGHFHFKPYKLTFEDGSTIYFEHIGQCAKSVGLSEGTLYIRLKTKNGYIKEVNATLSPCNA